jgi:hypothetical protein
MLRRLHDEALADLPPTRRATGGLSLLRFLSGGAGR